MLFPAPLRYADLCPQRVYLDKTRIHARCRYFVTMPGIWAKTGRKSKTQTAAAIGRGRAGM